MENLPSKFYFTHKEDPEFFYKVIEKGHWDYIVLWLESGSPCGRVYPKKYVKKCIDDGLWTFRGETHDFNK